MTLTIQLPDELAFQLGDASRDLGRAALEAFAVEEYRAHRMTHGQLCELLALSRWDVDRLLKEHQVWLDYTAEDFRKEGEDLQKLAERPSRD